MGNYVEKHLYENELIVEKAQRDCWGLIGIWVLTLTFALVAAAAALLVIQKVFDFTTVLLVAAGIFGVAFLISLIVAIYKTIIFTRTELVLTNKRIVYKRGVFSRKSFDTPLNKLQDVRVETTFWGNVFNTNKIYISTLAGSLIVEKIQNAEEFKSIILGQINQFEEDRLARQAQWTAQAMAKNVPAQATQQTNDAHKQSAKEKQKARRDFNYYGY